MTGRPTKCTPERVRRIIDALKGGNTRKASAAYGGISHQAFADWMNRGEAGEKPFLDFSTQVKAAEAEAEVRNVAIIQKAAIEKWQAAAWWLERRRNDEWGLKSEQRVTLEGNPDKPIVTQDATPADKLVAHLKTLKALRDAGLSDP